MPRQNRVTPTGEIIATPARGTLMGNRGLLHDDEGRIRRAYQVKRWIICLLAYKGRWRPVMSPGQYTELFFLDEATALAAGHRPCAQCQYTRFMEFKTLWAVAHSLDAEKVRVDDIDTQLHAERTTPHKPQVNIETLPEGVFILWEEGPHLIQGDVLLPWQPEGYGPSVARPRDTNVTLLTPPSIVNVIRAGFRPIIHTG
ncbi:MAG: hypothetical protein OHK0046_12120 [Anaerolineae bacterium]